MGRYDGKNVVITGGSSGLGLAAAQFLVDNGARVMVTGRGQGTLDDASRRLGDNGPESVAAFTEDRYVAGWIDLIEELSESAGAGNGDA